MEIKNNKIHQNIGIKITQYRHEKGISQKDLVFDAEIDISTISRLERGILNPKLNTLIAICQVLDIHLKNLLDFEE